jgi:hypothetical protein
MVVGRNDRKGQRGLPDHPICLAAAKVLGETIVRLGELRMENGELRMEN